jgi:signal peptidase I
MAGMEDTDDERRMPRALKWAIILAVTAAILGGVWVAAKHFGYDRYLYYRRFTLPSDAMRPTLASGETFFADMGNIEPIRRGDLLVVRLGREDWIKRVVALPGDRIALKDGVIWLNGEKVPQRDLGPSSYIDAYDGTTQKVTLFEEQLPGEAKPHQLYDVGPTYADEFAEKTVPEGCYFFLGDHRDRSGDSRTPAGELANGMGMVERAQITGRVILP